MPDECRLSAEEIFGPVAPIATFADPDEAVARANDTEHGLVAYLFTNDIRRAFDLIDRLDVGMVAPFGGVKQSGFRREGGPEGIDEYLDTKYVAFGAG